MGGLTEVLRVSDFCWHLWITNGTTDRAVPVQVLSDSIHPVTAAHFRGVHTAFSVALE